MTIYRGNVAPGEGASVSTLDNVKMEHVEGLTALRALVPKPEEPVYLTYRSTLGDGGGGVFYWDSSDLSTEVTADTQSGIYVAPDSDPTGASGAWVRQYDGAVNVKWFGAITGTGVSSILSQALQVGNVVLDEPYLMDADVALVSNRSIMGGGSLTRSGGTVYKFTAGDKTDRTAIVAASDFVAGDSILHLSAAGYSSVSVGDYIFGEDRDNPSGTEFGDFIPYFVANPNQEDDWIYQTQCFKVLEKLGSDKIRVDHAAKVDFPVATANYYILNDVVTGVTVSDITFNNSYGSLQSSESSWFNLQCIFDSLIENNNFNLAGESGGIYITLGEIDVVNNLFSRGAYLDVFFRQAVANSAIYLNKFKAHNKNDACVFIEAHCYNNSVAVNQFDGSRAFDDTVTNAAKLMGAIQMDAKVTGCTVTSNTMNGLGFGVRMELGCRDNVISNNTMSNIEINGMRCQDIRENIISHNTLLNCGTAGTEAGTLQDDVSAIFMSSCIENDIVHNNISYNEVPNITWSIQVLAGSYNSIDWNKIRGTSSCISIKSNHNSVQFNTLKGGTKVGLIAIDGGATPDGSRGCYNKVSNNTLVTESVSANSHGVGVTNGAECNYIHNNTQTGGDYIVYSDSSVTMKSQSIHKNVREWASDATIPDHLVNHDITAPIYPTYAVMPRDFRIYQCIGASNQLAGQGDDWWEFKQNLSGTGKIFRKFAITDSQVII